MRLLATNPKASAERQRCAEAAEEEQRSQDALSEARYSSNIAEQALSVSKYQSWAMFWQALAMIAAFFATAFAAVFAWIAIGEGRRIGEAQTRAYITMTKAEAAFIDPSRSGGDVGPVIDFTIENSGQSPAVDFVYNFTVQYLPIGNTKKIIMERGFGGNWRERKISIPKGTVTDGRAISGMKLVKFLKSVAGANQDAVMVHVKVNYEFDDVFGEHIVGEARFMGFHYLAPTKEPRKTDFGLTMWHGELHPMPTSTLWHPEGVEIT